MGIKSNRALGNYTRAIWDMSSSKSVTDSFSFQSHFVCLTPHLRLRLFVPPSYIGGDANKRYTGLVELFAKAFAAFALSYEESTQTVANAANITAICPFCDGPVANGVFRSELTQKPWNAQKLLHAMECEFEKIYRKHGS
jgi:hypothetical protein